MGKAERIWEVADLPTLSALPCSSAAQGSRGGPMFESPLCVASRGDAPNALEPCDPMPVEISSFSEAEQDSFSVILLYFYFYGENSLFLSLCNSVLTRA